jgi:hypothetical protein
MTPSNLHNEQLTEQMYHAIVDEICRLTDNLNRKKLILISLFFSFSHYHAFEDNHLIIEITEMNPNFQLAVDQ